MAQNGFDGKRCFLTGAASGIGRATALKLAVHGAELYLTDRDAEGLATTVADARALGAEVPEHRVLDISDFDEVTRFGADIHANHPAMDVVMNIAGVSAWGTVDRLTHDHLEVDDRHQPDGADPRHRGVPAADGRGAPRRAPGQRVLGGRAGRVAVARRLQRQQVRPAWPFRGVAIRPRAPPHRRIRGGARRGENPSGAFGSDCRRGSRSSRREEVDRPVRRHAVSPEHVADRILRGVVRNRFIVYTSPDIRALYMFKRAAWWPYSVAMRQVNVVFSRALRPGLK